MEKVFVKFIPAKNLASKDVEESFAWLTEQGSPYKRERDWILMRYEHMYVIYSQELYAEFVLRWC